VLIGRLALPSLLAQALAPLAGAVAIERFGALPTVAALLVLALANLVLVLSLWLFARSARNSQPSSSG
jgi:hypothetical protein